MPNEALRKACEIAGGQSKLAGLIGTSQSQIWFWLNEAKKGVAAEFVIPVEAATGVPRSELRPDIYPPAAASSQKRRANLTTGAAR